MKKTNFKIQTLLLFLSVFMFSCSNDSDSLEPIQPTDNNEYRVSFNIAGYEQQFVPIGRASRVNATDYFNTYSITIIGPDDFKKTIHYKGEPIEPIALKKGSYNGIITASVENADEQIIKTDYHYLFGGSDGGYSLAVYSSTKGGLIPFQTPIEIEQGGKINLGGEKKEYMADAQYELLSFDVTHEKTTIDVHLKRVPMAQLEYIPLDTEFPDDISSVVMRPNPVNYYRVRNQTIQYDTKPQEFYTVVPQESVKFWVFCLGEYDDYAFWLSETIFDENSGYNMNTLHRSIKLKEGKKTIVKSTIFKDSDNDVNIIDYDTSVIDWDNDPIIEER